MNRNVVLLAINSKYIHSSLAVWTIKAAIEENAQIPHDVNIVEVTIHQPFDEIIGEIAAFKPNIIGVSTYIWNASMLPGLLKSLRQRFPKAIIVLGGPEAEHNIDYWLEQGADHVLRGEGEYTFPAFLNKLGTQGDGSVVSNHCTAQYLAPDMKLDTTEPSPCVPPDPYTNEFFTSVENRLIYFESSRGCPFSCAYCLSAETTIVFFPMEVVKERLFKLSQIDSKTIKFVDRTFNCDPKRAYELFEYIIKLDTNCCFHFEVAADLFDEQTISLLEAAPLGRIQFEIGLQSFFEPAIKAVSRKTDLEKAVQNIKRLLQCGNIHIHVDLIAGLPYETLQDFINSFEQAYELGAHTLQLGFLKLLHGSVLRKQAEHFGINYSSEPPYEIQSSTWLSAEDLHILKQTENALQHTHNKGRFLRTIDYVLSATKLHPFSFFNALGKAAPNHAVALQDYAVQILDFCAILPGVDKNTLCDNMVCDWLSMVKGKNMPTILRNPDNRRKHIFEQVKKQYNHKIRRDEVRVLTSSEIVFVDSSEKSPVTGLYTLQKLTLEDEIVEQSTSKI